MMDVLPEVILAVLLVSVGVTLMTPPPPEKNQRRQYQRQTPPPTTTTTRTLCVQDRVETVADGNCMFDAIFKQMQHNNFPKTFGDGKYNIESYMDLKRSMVEYARGRNFGDFLPINPMDPDSENAISWNKWCVYYTDDNRQRTWGDDTAIDVIEMMLNVSIHVWNTQRKQMTKKFDRDDDDLPTLVILYNGSNHYYSTRCKSPVAYPLPSA